MARLVDFNTALVQLVSKHTDFLSQHANFLPGSECGDPVGNWHLNCFPHNLLDGLIRHVEGVGGADNVKSFVDIVKGGSNNRVEVAFKTFVVADETIGASSLDNLIG